MPVAADNINMLHSPSRTIHYTRLSCLLGGEGNSDNHVRSAFHKVLLQCCQAIYWYILPGKYDFLLVFSLCVTILLTWNSLYTNLKYHDEIERGLTQTVWRMQRLCAMNFPSISKPCKMGPRWPEGGQRPQRGESSQRSSIPRKR